MALLDDEDMVALIQASAPGGHVYDCCSHPDVWSPSAKGGSWSFLLHPIVTEVASIVNCPPQLFDLEVRDDESKAPVTLCVYNLREVFCADAYSLSATIAEQINEREPHVRDASIIAFARAERGMVRLGLRITRLVLNTLEAFDNLKKQKVELSCPVANAFTDQGAVLSQMRRYIRECGQRDVVRDDVHELQFSQSHGACMLHCARVAWMLQNDSWSLKELYQVSRVVIAKTKEMLEKTRDITYLLKRRMLQEGAANALESDISEKLVIKTSLACVQLCQTLITKV